MSDSLSAALLGLLAASLAALLTQPADVIKTKLMTSDVVADLTALSIKKVH